MNIFAGVPYSSRAGFHAQNLQSCAAGTREEILRDIYHWINTEDSKSCIYWISGLAGTGKTTIAYTVAEECNRRGILGASFFCSRDDVNLSSSKLVFATIAHQLGRFYPPFQEQLFHAYREDPDLQYFSVSSQLEHLLVKLLPPVRDKFPRCVIVLDGLDECSDDDTTSTILSSLSLHIDALKPLKFLVTSRPTRKIIGGFQLPSLRQTTQSIALQESTQDSVERDIERYLVASLGNIQKAFVLDDGWPSMNDVHALTRLSSGLFVFAATAVKSIGHHYDPQLQLQRLLNSTPGDGGSLDSLDSLYMHILFEAFLGISPQLSVRFKSIIGSIALLHHPLSPTDIEALLNLERGAIRNIAVHLGPVLVVPDDDNKIIRIIHPSFFDFLTNPARCSHSQFAVDPGKQHAVLARACLGNMKVLLKRDICGIRDPSKANSEVEDLSERIDRHIPLHLQYATRSWAYHCSRSTISDLPVDPLRQFCVNSILYWVEACSLMGDLGVTLSVLNEAFRLISRIGITVSDVLELLSDCERFILRFFPTLSTTASQTYYLALQSTPTDTLLRKTYNYELNYPKEVRSGVDQKWGPCLYAIEGHTNSIWSVVFSPDGAHLASGSGDGTIRLWDALTGTLLQTLRSKSSFVAIHSVAFSPNGAQIVSGLSDHSVQLWDAILAAHSAALEGHTGPVMSVVFSPDGRSITSGSNDETIRIWDAPSGAQLKVLRGHTGPVISVVFSPDGHYLASGSHDHTVRIWDTSTGVFLRTLKGRSSGVTSLAYSPDGSRIASGSQGATIRIWDANGTKLKTLKGHSGDILSIVYSPDGNHIASGSRDAVVQVQDAKGTNLRALRGHSGSVTSVAYSPDGVKIVSGSFDKTIRIWDANYSPKTANHLNRALAWLKNSLP